MNYTEEAKQNFNDLSKNPYPGRGIVLGTSADDKSYVQVYWIMGRSVNSRNRVFEIETDTGFMKTKAFDESKLTDPHLIIYYPARHTKDVQIITNGDQTDTIFDGLRNGMTFEQSLRSRKYEHDAPNYTPRISSLLTVDGGKFDYALSILKSDGGNPDNTIRITFSYDNPQNGKGHFIHTYQGDGNPLPSFEGEPEPVEIKGTIDEFAGNIWNSLNGDNKVSLFVRFIDIKSGEYKEIIFNKNR